MQILDDAARRAIAYLNSLHNRPVSPRRDAMERLDNLDTPVPQKSTASSEVLARLDELVSPATMAMAGPRFFGFVIGGSLPAALAANWLAATWDQNCAFDSVTPGVARLEQSALRWLIDLFDLPPHTAAGVVTGAPAAHF